jgi:predicted NBD/HSP70 family sugar kinase
VAAEPAGHLLELVRSGQARTRSDLQVVTGLSRSTVTSRVDDLVSAGFLRERGVVRSPRGRPSIVLEFNEQHGVVLAADLGATHARAAVCDLGGRSLAERRHTLRIAGGPQTVLGWVERTWRELLTTAGVAQESVLGLAASVPGPVDVATGRTVHPPIMPGWHDYPIRERLENAFGVPGFVDNDANAMAFGEYHAGTLSCSSLLFVKVATGIGAGMVVDGRLVRGADGGAGDIGHVRLGHPDSGPLCACGARGCLAASASGGAIARQLREQHLSADTSRAAVRLAQAGDPRAIALVRESGLLIGEVLATAVSLLNPRALVVGGDLVRAQDHFMGALRERLYQRTQPLATRHLQVVTSSLGDRAGVLGAARLVVEQLFGAEAVNAALAGTGRLTPTGRPGREATPADGRQ